MLRFSNRISLGGRRKPVKLAHAGPFSDTFDRFLLSATANRVGNRISIRSDHHSYSTV